MTRAQQYKGHCCVFRSVYIFTLKFALVKVGHRNILDKLTHYLFELRIEKTVVFTFSSDCLPVVWPRLFLFAQFRIRRLEFEPCVVMKNGVS